MKKNEYCIYCLNLSKNLYYLNALELLFVLFL
nr:MAG TPA: Putative zinc ribbon domain [Caudoviricetes sp.]DAY97301.1 MAG TPA: Putative zinc ribbon domain [Caudoviricetes sp.]